MTRVLLTGATGFIGSHVARNLVARGCQVHAMIRPTANRERLLTIENRLHVAPGDVMDSRSIERIASSERFDLCIHSAWYAVPGKYLHAKENLDHAAASL